MNIASLFGLRYVLVCKNTTWKKEENRVHFVFFNKENWKWKGYFSI